MISLVTALVVVCISVFFAVTMVKGFIKHGGPFGLGPILPIMSIHSSDQVIWFGSYDKDDYRCFALCSRLGICGRNILHLNNFFFSLCQAFQAQSIKYSVFQSVFLIGKRRYELDASENV